MSFLLPERVPVNVYKWDDVGAPQLDKSPNCVATIFKACLAIGYGDKEPAGWTMPFEDTSAGVKVLRPKIGSEADYYLRLSADTGSQMTAQIYLDMTNINSGSLKLKCATAFTYATGRFGDKWVLVASPRGFWFFAEDVSSAATNDGKKGTYFFAGDTTGGSINNMRQVALTHSGGINSYAVIGAIRKRFHNAVHHVPARIYSPSDAVALDTPINTLFYDLAPYTDSIHVSPLAVFYDKNMHTLPGVFSQSLTSDFVNYAIPTDPDWECIIHSASNFEPEMLLIRTDYWEY